MRVSSLVVATFRRHASLPSEFFTREPVWGRMVGFILEGGTLCTDS